MRKYSLREIDQLRDDITFLRSNPDPDVVGRVVSESVEEELRTVMAAGVSPTDVRRQRDERDARVSYHRDWGRAITENRQRDCAHPVWQCSCYGCMSFGRYGCHGNWHYRRCARCDMPDRRRGERGRPGGRRRSDVQRTPTPESPVVVNAEEPAPTKRRRWTCEWPVFWRKCRADRKCCR